MSPFEADYVVMGSGAVGMAFADTILTETDNTIAIIDRHAKPGGHWNDAYSFVRLHQPSAFYGVASRPLGSNRIDETGSNNGYYELASGAEVSAYFEQVMAEQFLPSGRVSYFPLHNYDNGQITSLMNGAKTPVKHRKKLVDGTYYNTSVPSTHTRKFAVDHELTCVTPNELPKLAQNFRHYVIIGAGKTAMDVGVWLVEAGAVPDNITWIMPRDSWLIDRETTQPGQEFFHQSIGGVAKQFEAMAQAVTIEDLFLRLEAADTLLRIDPSVRPTMYHCATISRGEVDHLRKIRNVVRKGKVIGIGKEAITLTDGTAPGGAEALYIDCTASAVEVLPSLPTFNGDRITLQMLRQCQPAFSAALVARIEHTMDDEAAKNALTPAIPLPDFEADWLTMTIANMTNQYNWSQDKELRNWITECRLDGFGKVVRVVDKADQDRQAVLTKLRENAFPAVANLHKLLAAHDPAG